jgi:hypothetical protein
MVHGKCCSLALWSCRPRGGVRAVMTPETSRKVGVAKVVRVRAPGNFQVWKNIAVVDRDRYDYGLSPNLHARTQRSGHLSPVRRAEALRGIGPTTK